MATTRIYAEDPCLTERMQRGDAQALALLYDRYSSLVYSIALRVLGDSVLAEQVLSDIFLEIWRSPKRLMQATGSLAPSLAMIARNRSLAMLHHKPAPELDFGPHPGIANHQEKRI